MIPFDDFTLCASTADLADEPAAREHADAVEFRDFPSEYEVYRYPSMLRRGARETIRFVLRLRLNNRPTHPAKVYGTSGDKRVHETG